MELTGGQFTALQFILCRVIPDVGRATIWFLMASTLCIFIPK